MREKFALPIPQDDGLDVKRMDVEMWKMLQHAKCKASTKALLATKGKYVYEFDRGAGGSKGRSKWGGCFTKDDTTKQEVFKGNNVMGEILMSVREEIMNN